MTIFYVLDNVGGNENDGGRFFREEKEENTSV